MGVPSFSTKVMNIHQTHYSTLPSTQKALIERVETEGLKQGQFQLITTEQQTQGVGQYGRSWLHHQAQGIAMSFTFAPHPILTLTALETGILVCDFLKQEFGQNLELKWPNDLFYQKKKVGGLIAQYMASAETLIVGLGLNITPQKTAPFPYHMIEVASEISSFSSQFPRNLYQFLLSHRIGDEKMVIKRFDELCVHHGMKTRLEGSDQLYTFIGLGSDGQALLEDSLGKTQEIFSGSLLFEGLGN